MSEELKYCKTCGATMRLKGFDYCDKACYMTDPAKLKRNRIFKKEDVEKAAKAYYEQEPWTYRDIAIEWKEFDEDGSGRSDKAVMIKRMTAALNAIGKVED